jgi:glycosyltransferase involved in cell wall biosynthesis
MLRKRRLTITPFGENHMTGRARPIRIVMVHQQTLGLRHDCIVLRNALRSTIPDVELFSVEPPGKTNHDYETPIEVPDELYRLLPFDVVFLFEHLLLNPPFMDPAFAHKRVFIPNIEWLTALDEQAIKNATIDAVLHKNELSASIFERIPGTDRIPLRTTIGWSSVDIGATFAQDLQGRDFNSFLHLRGVSIQKQTDVVIETWLQNPEFPRLTVVATMRDDFSVPVPLRAADNIEIRIGRLPTAELRSLQFKCGIHVCPSLSEGFGHSLNEARSCGSVLITTNGPPMRDFVVHGISGMHVPVRGANIGEFRKSISFRVCAEDLASTVRQVLKMPPDERRKIGCSAREHFLKDRAAFEAAIAELFGTSGPLALRP